MSKQRNFNVVDRAIRRPNSSQAIRTGWPPGQSGIARSRAQFEEAFDQTYSSSLPTQAGYVSNPQHAEPSRPLTECDTPFVAHGIICGEKEVTYAPVD